MPSVYSGVRARPSLLHIIAVLVPQPVGTSLTPSAKRIPIGCSTILCSPHFPFGDQNIMGVFVICFIEIQIQHRCNASPLNQPRGTTFLSKDIRFICHDLFVVYLCRLTMSVPFLRPSVLIIYC